MDADLEQYFAVVRKLRGEIEEALDLVRRVRGQFVLGNGNRKRVYLLINLDAKAVDEAVWGVLSSIDDAEKTIDSLRQLVPDPEYFPPLLIQSWEVGTWTESAP
jgi:hypothetical protein